MKLFATILLTLSFAALASAQTYKAFSVANVAKTGDNVYTAEKYIADTHGEANAGDVAQRFITFKTVGCKHNPGKDATAIYLMSPDGDKLLFSDGGTCKVDSFKSTASKVAEEPTPTGAAKK